MRHLSRTFGAIALVALAGAVSPVQADSVVITRGKLAIEGFGGPDFKLAGQDFKIAGGGDEGFAGVQLCFPCAAGETIQTDAFFAGSSLGSGKAKVDGVVYSLLFFGGEFGFDGPNVTIPTDARGHLTFDVPFTLSGFLSAFSDSAQENLVFTKDLSGSGTLRFRLLEGAPLPGGPRLFDFQRAVFRFGQSSPTPPIPEPASLVLVGTGALGVVAGKRQRSIRRARGGR